jgi:hypothetical protein
MPGHHDICIMKAKDGYRVRPAVWSTNGKKSGGNSPKVTFRNLTDADVLLVFPSEMLDITGNPPQKAQVSIGPARTAAGATTTDIATVLLREKNDAEIPGVYPYSVIVLTAKGATQAVGESEPIVIIDPPPA